MRGRETGDTPAAPSTRSWAHFANRAAVAIEPMAGSRLREATAGSTAGPAVGVFGHYGNQNLGDESIIAAVIQNLRRRVPDIRLYGMSSNPADTRARHEIESFAIRWSAVDALSGAAAAPDRAIESGTQTVARQQPSGFERIKEFFKGVPLLAGVLRGVRDLWRVVEGLYREVVFLRRCIKFAKAIDLLFIAGSNQFLDNHGGAFAFPYTLFKWTVLAKAAGKKVALVSVGAGPLDGWASKLFVNGTIRLSDYCSVRDHGSRKLIQTLGRSLDPPVYPDLAYSLAVDRLRRPATRDGAAPCNIGINPMPVFDGRYWPVADAQRYRAYTQKLAIIARDLIDRQHSIIFFATQKADDLVIQDVVGIMADCFGAEYRDRITTPRCLDLSSLLALIAGLDLVVATRFHGTVLSLLMERPVLGICYQVKTFEVMSCYGLEEYAVHVETFEPNDVVEKIAALWQNRDAIAEDIIATNRTQRLALDEQYERVLSLCLNLQIGEGHGRSG